MSQESTIGEEFTIGQMAFARWALDITVFIPFGFGIHIDIQSEEKVSGLRNTHINDETFLKKFQVKTSRVECNTLNAFFIL